MADCVFAIAGKDFVIIASDLAATRSILKIQDEDSKLTQLANNQILAVSGENADRNDFSKLIRCELDYYYYRYNHRLNTDQVANFTRCILAENLRKSPYAANCVIAGFDDGSAHLYWLDYLGSLQKVTKAAQGYGSHFMYSIMDNFFNSNFSLEEGKKCIGACINELRTRFVINMTNFHVKVIDKDGITDISEIYRI